MSYDMRPFRPSARDAAVRDWIGVLQARGIAIPPLRPHKTHPNPHGWCNPVRRLERAFCAHYGATSGRARRRLLRQFRWQQRGGRP